MEATGGLGYRFGGGSPSRFRHEMRVYTWMWFNRTIRMALLFRGAGPGSHWHARDARTSGFTPHSPGATPSIDFIMSHIALASTTSPYISFTRSFGVALAYAQIGPKGFASAVQPGYVYEIEISDDKHCEVLDPVVEIAKALPKPWSSPCYQHDGEQSFLLGVVNPTTHLQHLQKHIVAPPGSSGTPRAANLSRELEALVRCLRDAEVLIQGNVPSSVIRNRYEVR
jgi:hypothetical protein